MIHVGYTPRDMHNLKPKSLLHNKTVHLPVMRVRQNKRTGALILVRGKKEIHKYDGIDNRNLTEYQAHPWTDGKGVHVYQPPANIKEDDYGDDDEQKEDELAATQK